MIIDAHVHVIEHIAGLGRRGELRAMGDGMARWVDGEEIRMLPRGWGDTSFSHGKLIEVMDAHGIGKAVLLQGSYYGFCNDYTFEAQQKYPDRLFGMGTFDPYCHEAKRIMERLVNDFKFRGFKFEMSRGFGFMGYHPDFRLDGSLMAPVWELAQGRALAVSLDLGTFGEPSMQVEAVATLAARYPGIRFVLEHIFFPGPAHFEDVEKALALLAPCQNVSVTVASVPASLPEKFPFPSTCRYIRIAKSTLGSERILWGSDLPSVAVNNTYRQLIDYVKESDVFDARELEGFYSGNAARVYRL